MAEKRFGDHELRTNPLVASEAIRLWTDIMRVATRAANRLPAIIYALSGEEGTSEDMADVAALLAVNDILRDTSSDVVLDLLRRLVGAAQVKQASGSYLPADLDQLFSNGNLKEVIPVARWVFVEQFADFFPASADGGILSLLRATLAKRK